jgi:hypothetical protein
MVEGTRRSPGRSIAVARDEEEPGRSDVAPYPTAGAAEAPTRRRSGTMDSERGDRRITGFLPLWSLAERLGSGGIRY